MNWVIYLKARIMATTTGNGQAIAEPSKEIKSKRNIMFLVEENRFSPGYT